MAFTRRNSLQQAVLGCLAFPCLLSTAFLNPAVWSRIQGQLRVFSSAPNAAYQGLPHQRRAVFPFHACRTRLHAAAPLSFGDFGDEFKPAEVKEQMRAMEVELERVMNLGLYEDAKKLVSEIMALKEFAERPNNGNVANPFKSALGDFMQPRVIVDMETATRKAAPATAAVVAPRGKSIGSSKSFWPQARSSAGAREQTPLEAVRKRHSDVTAHGVRVEVFSYFRPSESRPEEHQYRFMVHIRVTNMNHDDIQVLSREWNIHKVDGSAPEFQDGFGGEFFQPVLAGGTGYHYNCQFGVNCVPEEGSKKYVGHIEGHLLVMLGDGTNVKVPIAPFWLEIPGDTLVLG